MTTSAPPFVECEKTHTVFAVDDVAALAEAQIPANVSEQGLCR